MTNRAIAGSASLVCAAIVALSFAAARPALADPKAGAIGQLVYFDGGTGSVNNLTTSPAFSVSKNLAVSVQCPDAGAWVAFDGRTTCSKGYPCIWVPPAALLDDTVRAPADGGGKGIIAMSCPAGVTSCACGVWDNSANVVTP